MGTPLLCSSPLLCHNIFSSTPSFSQPSPPHLRHHHVAAVTSPSSIVPPSPPHPTRPLITLLPPPPPTPTPQTSAGSIECRPTATSSPDCNPNGSPSPTPQQLKLFHYHMFQMNCSAPSNVYTKSLFLNHGIISTKAGNRGNPSRNMPGFARLHNSNRSTCCCLTNGNGGARQLNNHGVTSRDGLIIVDHGSRRKESNLMLNEFVAMFMENTGYPIVEPAHMELAEPSIRDAFRSCVEKGASRVIVSPFFLFPGRHWHQDIPSLTAEAAKDFPGVSYMITAPLGLHPLLVDVVDDRIKHCLSHVAGDADECAVCAGTGKCHLY